jgi:hypothetical protein
MPKTRSRPSRRKAVPRRRRVPSDAALRAAVLPIVKELVAEELARLEDEADVRASREAMAEGGAVPHEEFWRRRGL